jgi:hypothetical protein
MGEDDEARARRDIEALIDLLKPEDRQSIRGMTETDYTTATGHGCAISSVRTSSLIFLSFAARRPHLTLVVSIEFPVSQFVRFGVIFDPAPLGRQMYLEPWELPQ